MFAESDAAGAGCAACVNTMCGADIQACETSCTCVNLFECLADAGISASSLSTGSLGAVAGCVPGGLTMAGALLSDPGVMGVYTCFTATCGTQCAAALPDAGIVAEGGAEEGGAGDAGARADAADGG
jgi:hypothetical protein